MQMADEIHEVRLLQRQVQQHRQDEETARVQAIEQAKREAREYRELMLQREVEKERMRRQAVAERDLPPVNQRDLGCDGPLAEVWLGLGLRLR